MAIAMSAVWKIRKAILAGKSVKNVAEEYKVSESIVRSYTKSERARVKDMNRKLERGYGVAY